MKKVAIAGVASVALLGLALLWSARLVEDVAPPPVPDTAPMVQTAPDDVPRARLAPLPMGGPPPPGAVPAPEPQPTAVTPPPPPTDAMPPAPGEPVPPDRRGETMPSFPEAEEPFGEESRELAYAFRLAENPESTPDQVRNAAEVFERCLKAQPDDQRCYRGLTMAQTRLNPPDVPRAPRHKDDGFVPKLGTETKGTNMKRSPIMR